MIFEIKNPKVIYFWNVYPFFLNFKIIKKVKVVILEKFSSIWNKLLYLLLLMEKILNYI